MPAAFAVGSSFESDWLSAEHSFQALKTPPLKLMPLPVDRGEDEEVLTQQDPEDEPGIPADLAKEGAVWNTRTQLSKLPGTAAVRPMVFDVIGDAEPGRFIWERALFGKKGVFLAQLQRIQGDDGEFVIQLGDMVSRGIARNYRHFYKDMEDSRLSKPYLSVIGNHDRHYPHGHTDARLYEGLFGPTDYSFDEAGVRFVMLDTSQEGDLTDAQLKWLDERLTTDKKKLVFTHMPPRDFKSWTVGMTGMKQGELFEKLMTEHKVDRVYMGHIHGYGIAQKGGVKYVLSGGGGSPLYLLPTTAPQLFYHYVTVSMDDKGIHETVHPLKSAPFEIVWPDQQGDFEMLLDGMAGQVASLH